MTLFVGNCMFENAQIANKTIDFLQTNYSDQDIVFKASFAKPNRSSFKSRQIGDFPDVQSAMLAWEKFASNCPFPTITDVHEVWQAESLTHTDYLQIPAFLSRQLPLIEAVRKANKPTLLKISQLMSSSGIQNAIINCNYYNNKQPLYVCYRGTLFGGNGDLVVDLRRMLDIIHNPHSNVFPVFDVSHSFQHMTGSDNCSSSSTPTRFTIHIAKAVKSLGCNNFFVELHPDPQRAYSDTRTQMDFDSFRTFMEEVYGINRN